MAVTRATASMGMLETQTTLAWSVQTGTLQHQITNAFIAQEQQIHAVTMVSVLWQTRPGVKSMKPFVIVTNRGSEKIAPNACCAMAMANVATQLAANRAIVTPYGLAFTVQNAEMAISKRICCARRASKTALLLRMASAQTALVQ